MRRFLVGTRRGRQVAATLAMAAAVSGAAVSGAATARAATTAVSSTACRVNPGTAGQCTEGTVAPKRSLATSTCAPVWFIGARGSGETSRQAYGTGENRITGMGKEVDYLAYAVRASLAEKGMGVEFEPVSYPADSINVLKPNATVVALFKDGSVVKAVAEYMHTSVDAYNASITQGIEQAEVAVAQVLSSCPNAKIVMGGYSQGAIAIHDAENWLVRNRPTEFKHIAGTLLLGDPDRVPNTKAKEFGDSPSDGRGLRVYLHLVAADDVPDPSTTANITNNNDLVGDFQGLSSVEHWQADAAVHSSYETTVAGRNLLASAAKWVASKVSAG
jgi:cutinase